MTATVPQNVYKTTVFEVDIIHSYIMSNLGYLKYAFSFSSSDEDGLEPAALAATALVSLCNDIFRIVSVNNCGKTRIAIL